MGTEVADTAERTLIRTIRNFGILQSDTNQRTERDPEAPAAQNSPSGRSTVAKRTLDGSSQAAVVAAAELRMKAIQMPLSTDCWW